MLKYFKLFGAIFFSAVMLSGCYPTGMIQNSNEEGQKTVYEIAEEIDNFTLSLTLSEDTENIPAEISKIRVTFQTWDNNKILELFLGGEPITEQYEYDDSSFKDGKNNVYFTESRYLGIRAGSISFVDQSVPEYGYVNLASRFKSFFLDEDFSYAEECSFPKSDAVNRANGILDEIGIQNYFLSETWAITADIANNIFADATYTVWYEDKTFEEFPFAQWTKDDEAYVLLYSVSYEELPVMTRSASFAGEFRPSGSCIYVVITKDKIISFECTYIYSERYETLEDIPVSISAQTSLENVVQYFSKQHLTTPCELFDCKLVYAPIESADLGTFILIPMWEFDYGTYGGDFGGLFMDRIYVDVQNGNRYDTRY